MSESATTIYQLRFVLRHITQLVWRRVLVRSDTTVAQLHHIVQVTMGWEDGPLHRFRIHGRDYGSSNSGGVLAGDPERVILASFRLRPPERFAYLYDFSAGWQHDIRLEQILAQDRVGLYLAGEQGEPARRSGKGAIDLVGREKEARSVVGRVLFDQALLQQPARARRSRSRQGYAWLRRAR